MCLAACFRLQFLQSLTKSQNKGSPKVFSQLWEHKTILDNWATSTTWIFKGHQQEPWAETTYLDWTLQEGGCNLHRNGGQQGWLRSSTQFKHEQLSLRAASAACSKMVKHREEAWAQVPLTQFPRGMSAAVSSWALSVVNNSDSPESTSMLLTLQHKMFFKMSGPTHTMPQMHTDDGAVMEPMLAYNIKWDKLTKQVCMSTLEPTALTHWGIQSSRPTVALQTGKAQW